MAEAAPNTVPSSEKASEKASVNASAKTGEPAMAPGGSGRGTILVVEDDAAMRTMLREALEEDGYTVEGAPGGRAGIERVKQGGIDLVISDVKMPDLDGI